MNIIVVLTFVVCLLDSSAAVRLRDNLNVLVPNNDVNIHADIKKLLNGDEVDPKDLSDNEIENLSDLRNPKIEKLLNKARSENKVFDDKNKNIEDNQIEREVSMLSHVDAISMVAIFTSPFDRQTASNVTSPTNDTLTSTLPSTFLTRPQTNGTTLTPSVGSTKSSTTSFPTHPVNQTERTTSVFTTTSSSVSTNTSTSYILSTTTSSFPTEAPTTTTTTEPIYDDLQTNECLLGKAERRLQWVNNQGNLVETFIHSQLGFVKFRDFSKHFNGTHDYEMFTRQSHFRDNFTDLKFLSVAHNNLNRLPHELISLSSLTLEFLSLAGNDFSFENQTMALDINFDRLPVLKELDLRSSKLRSIKPEFLRQLPSLQYLYLSSNHIIEVIGEPFPHSLIHLDLSYNVDTAMISDGVKMVQRAFSALNNLRTLDLSFSKIALSSIAALFFLPRNLIGLSLCYTSLPTIGDTFLNSSVSLRYLDISGNTQLILNPRMFTAFSESLQVLHVRSSNVRNLNWTLPLNNLKLLDLYDNNINTVTSTCFSHMTNLLKLNLERNTIGNWFERLFAQNQQLEILNLRENKLTLLTNHMKEDLSSVQLLAIGNNDFECTCVLQEFMHKLFEATRNANVTVLRKDKESDLDSYEYEEDERVVVDSTRVSLGVRNYFRPEYDVISRTYQKYYEMVAQSIEALRIRTTVAPQSRGLVMRSKAENTAESFQTVLFDYDEDDDDYQCMNVTKGRRQMIIDLNDLCDDKTHPDDRPTYKTSKNNALLSLSIAIPTVLVASVLLIVIYWKWWYIKYFFVLCKNSAILTFMDDSDGKEAIIKGKNDDRVETFLYDVFVSYSDQNRDWVLDEFIPNVEKRESINVCLHERDFQVGFGILENIVSCMDRSRCLLLLISENFLLSQWCQFEMNLAQHRLLETRRDKLILVLLEDIPVRKQPKTLKYLMRTKTYIKWPVAGSADEKQLFWRRLKKSITSSKWETETYGSIV